MGDITGKRLEGLRHKLKQKGIDAALVAKKENVTYMSGFNGGDSYLIITMGEAFLITDSRYAQQAAVQAPLYSVIKYQGSVAAALSDIVKKAGAGSVGFEEGYLTYQAYNEFKAKLGVETFVPMNGAVEELRLVKDREEIEIIKKAVKIADDAFTHILGLIRPGTAEIEIAAELEFYMKRHGAKGPSFETIVASGERGSMPHGVASDKKIQTGEAITMDYGAIYMDYCSDMTRTVFLGTPDDELRKIYEVVLKAQSQALNGAKEGLTGKEADSIARGIIKDAGYDRFFGHGLGHGVGLEIHEEPRLSVSGLRRLENGMVATVEPGIYIEKLGGVRIEDMIVINGGSPLVLTESSKELIII